jgi:hypothetical protein
MDGSSVCNCWFHSMMIIIIIVSQRFCSFQGVRVNYQAFLIHYSAEIYESNRLYRLLLLNENIQPWPKRGSFNFSCSCLGQYPLWVIFRSAAATSGPGFLHSRGLTVTLRHTTLGRTPLKECSARCREYTTLISERLSLERLRLHGSWDRHS